MSTDGYTGPINDETEYDDDGLPIIFDETGDRIPMGYDDDDATFICDECGRIFDLTDGADASEWYYGHDCEGK